VSSHGKELCDGVGRENSKPDDGIRDSGVLYRTKVQAVSTIGQFLYYLNLKVFQAYLVETGTDEEMSQDAVMGIIGSLFQFLVENSEGDLGLV
jgi:hypothetical protein